MVYVCYLDGKAMNLIGYELKSAVEWTDEELKMFRERYRISYQKVSDTYKNWDKILLTWNVGEDLEFDSRNSATQCLTACQRRNVKVSLRKLARNLFKVTRLT